MKKKSKRGFASMSKDQVRAIAARGGRAIFRKYGRRHMQIIGRLGGYS